MIVLANYRRKAKNTAKKLVKYGGKVVTIGHAAHCVSKGFKGCSASEIAAIEEVVARVARAAKRRK